MTGTSGSPISTWRTVLRGWRVFVPAIAIYAVAQYLLIAPDVTPAVTPPFLTLVAIAYVLDVALVAAASIGASAAARGLPVREALAPPHRGARLARIIGWSALGVAAVSFTALMSAIAAGVLLLVGAGIMPAVVAFRGPRGWFRPLRWVPVRSMIWAAASYAALVASAFADAEIGFLVGGPVGAATARIVTGVIGVIILCASAVLAEHAEARRDAHLARVRPSPALA